MKTLLAIIATACLLSMTNAQETNAPEKQTSVRRGPIPYMERVERGFGQSREPRFAGERPEWMNRGENGARPDFANEMRMRKELVEAQGQVDRPQRPAMGRGFGGPRGPAMGRGFGGPRGPSFAFRGGEGIQRGCPLCEKHKKMMSKKHGENRGGDRKGGPRHR